MSEVAPETRGTADAVAQDRRGLQPAEGTTRALRARLSLRGELVLALFPTAVVLGVLALVEVLSEQRLLFASLASSAFLIYLDPQHGTNRVFTLVGAQLLAAVLGLMTHPTFGSSYLAVGSAMTLTIFLMVVLDLMHPPAVATALSFTLKAGDASNVLLFALAVAITAVLVGLQRTALWLLARSVSPRKQS